MRYPDDIGPIRLLGVSFSNLEEPSQDVLFPFLGTNAHVEEEWESGVRDTRPTPEIAEMVGAEESGPRWHPTQDVTHPEYGHGWIQGLGHGVVTVRFETRTTALEDSFIKTFPLDGEHRLQAGDALDCLDWGDWLEQRDRVDPAGDRDS